MAVRRTSPKALMIVPKFFPSFWNMSLMCELKGAKYPVPPLGLLTVAAMLPPSWEVRLVDENVRPLTGADLEWAEVVLLTAMITQWARLRELIQLAKTKGKTVMVGGPLASSLPDKVREAGADFVVRGEAENILEAVVAAFRAGETGGVFAAAAKPALTDSPLPRYDLIRLEDYMAMAVQTCRGCPFGCEFCDVVSLFGRKPRRKRPQQVMAELDTLYRLGWRDGVFIVDDNFIGSKAHAREMLEHITAWQAAHGEPFTFWTQVSVNLGQDRDLIDRMTAANFGHVYVGVESPDPEVLRAVHKHQNTAQPLLESLCTIRDNGLTVVGSFMMGFDHEVPGVGERIAALADAAALPNSLIYLLSPLPNTKLWHRLKQEGRLLEEELWEFLDSGKAIKDELFFLPSRPKEELMAEFRRLGEYLYRRENFMVRAFRYYLAMRPTRAAQAKAQGRSASSVSPLPKREPWKKVLQDARSFCRLAWIQGVKPSCRWQFWSQLLRLLYRNPSRTILYLNALAMAEEARRAKAPDALER